MKKLLKKIPKTGTYIIPCVVIACVLIYAILLRLNAEERGTTLGQTTGSQVGKFIGSFDALTDYRKAYAEGKVQGLSAEDTTAEIASKIKEAEKLEVLVASVKLNDIHTIGEKYAALYLLKGDAVFSVDLSKAEIREDSNGLAIVLPPVEMDLIVDQSKIEKVAEYQQILFDGKTEDGFEAYLNSMAKIVEESKEALVNYDSLKTTAEETAIKQVKQLANSVAVSKREITVTFKEEQ